MNSFRITMLADNSVSGHGMRGEHGLCYHIETGRRRLLFDTGQGLVLADNAKALGIDLGAIDTVILSHGHYDHAGGLARVLGQARQPVGVYLHPDALDEKYHVTKTQARSIGVPLPAREALARSCLLIFTRQPVEIVPGIHCTGEIPRTHPEEPPAEIFHLDPDGQRIDPLLDDQSLFLDTPQGIVVLLGCAHAGVINILDHVRKLTDHRPIRAVLGGMHLGKATAARLQWTLDSLQRIGPELMVPMHCTGPKAIAALWQAFPDIIRSGGAGAVFEFQ